MNDPVNRHDDLGTASLPNWAKVGIGVAFIAGLAVATVCTGGAVAVVCGVALSGALMGGASGAVIGAIGGAMTGGVQKAVPDTTRPPFLHLSVLAEMLTFWCNRKNINFVM